MCFTRINVQLYKVVSILILSVVFTILLLQNTDRIRLVHHLLIPKVCETSLHSLESWSNLVNLCQSWSIFCQFEFNGTETLICNWDQLSKGSNEGLFGPKWSYCSFRQLIEVDKCHNIITHNVRLACSLLPRSCGQPTSIMCAPRTPRAGAAVTSAVNCHTISVQVGSSKNFMSFVNRPKQRQM